MSMHSHSVSKGDTNKWRITVNINEGARLDIVIRVGDTTLSNSYASVDINPKSIKVDLNSTITGTEHLVDITELVEAYMASPKYVLG